MKSTIKITVLSGLLLTGSLYVRSQSFLPATSTQTLYPTIATGSLNLDKDGTKYLSNASFPGSGIMAGTTLQVAGWSTDSNGGFSYGFTNPVPPYNYIGRGALAIPNARDVQVNIMKFSSNNFIIASYYDVVSEQYAFDLYSLLIPTPSTFTVTKLYTYHFEDPDFSMPAYTPTSDYTPVIAGGLPVPVTTTRMGYNRISMDVNPEGDKVVMVMSNNDNSYMYLAAGQLNIDTIIFSPHLPGNEIDGGVSTGSPEVIPSPYVCTFSAPWMSGGGGTYWDYFDPATGIYVRYNIVSNDYYYSYYPIDRNLFITVVNASGVVTSRIGATGIYNPLLGVKANSLVTTPGKNSYFKQIWPDVCFNGNYVSMVFYVNNPDSGHDPISLQPNGAEDLYVSYHNEFNYFYDYTGAEAWGPSDLYLRAGPNHIIVSAFNTFDKRTIRESPTTTFLAPPPTYTEYNSESLCKSLPLKPGEEIRAKIDAPDNGSEHYAVTFAYSGVPVGGYSAYYPAPAPIPSSLGPSPLPPFYDTVFRASEAGKNNIIVRYDGYKGQAILTNGSIKSGHVAINNQKNISPAIAYAPSDASQFAVAWISEKAAAGTGNIYSYIGLQINSSISYGAPGYLVSGSDYLRIPASPSLTNYSGLYPLIALSKRNDGITNLYTCFSQQDAGTAVYSIQHKNHAWVSVTGWKPTGIGTLPNTACMAVSPNPFGNTLHVSSTEYLSINIFDVSGRSMLNCDGSAEEINHILDRKAPELPAGFYIMNAIDKNGNKNIFKLTKQ